MQWENSIRRHAYPVIGSMSVSDIEVADIFKILEPIWRSKTETALRVRAGIENVLHWAKLSHLRTGENPAQWRGNLDQLLPAVSKSRVQKRKFLPCQQIGAFIVSLRRRKSPAASVLEFLILTAVPTVTVIGAKRSEFSFADRLWLVPAGRTKNRREHRIPLSRRALEIALERAGRSQSNSDFLFPGSTPAEPMSNGAMLMLLRRMGLGGLTIDGFRSTFAEWANDVGSKDLVDRALGLNPPGPIGPEKSRHFELRRGLMDQWAAYIELKVLEHVNGSKERLQM